MPPPLALPKLSRLELESTVFAPPSKRIHDGADLAFFHSSLAYRDLSIWLLQLNRAMFPVRTGVQGERSGGGEEQHERQHRQRQGPPSLSYEESRLDAPPVYSATVTSLRLLLGDLKELIALAPPDTGPRRFGNVAFRTWMKAVEEKAGGLLEKRLGDALGLARDGDGGVALREELCVYLLGSFGSAQRLDYGTGHELSFLAFLAGLWKVGALGEREERAVVVGVVQLYLELVRTLVMTYTLEPAGSHGVWGLDDHSFVPYIFGSAQLGPAIDPDDGAVPTPTEGSLPSAPAAGSVTDKRFVADFQEANIYFSAIQFIYDVKKGPFWEHSPVLYDVSGIKDGWGKINKGMMKMYAAEVLGKFPVVQHFPFGGLFKWEADPDARTPGQANVHAQQQPKSMDAPPAPAPTPMAGTAAPWANRSRGAGSQQPITPMQPTRGLASARAPAAAATQRNGVAMAPTAAPWGRGG